MTWNIALTGCGTVGKALLELLHEKREILKTGYVINQQLTNLRKSCALPQLSGEKHAVGRHA